ncbi:MAG: hypothetical protein HY070_06725, partial [Chloroflexi bacterium]|nr:hypothetical protein [Chloroflexota bacterium]
GELGLGCYALVGGLFAWQHNFWWAIPYLFLYAAGFFYTGFLSVAHGLPKIWRRSFKISRLPVSRSQPESL